MGGYLVNFSVYTFAMVGFLFLAVAIYKKSSIAAGGNNKDSGMAIEESLSLSPRKRLHVVRVNGEKFLIAADVDRTEFLAKLDDSEKLPLTNNVIHLNKQPKLASQNEEKSVLNKRLQAVQNTIQGNVAIKTYPDVKYQETKLSHIKSINMKKPPIMREILRKLEIPQA